MPMPTRNPEETHDDFMARCISEVQDEFEGDQAVAICQVQWEKPEEANKMDYKHDTKVIKFELKAVDEETGIFEGYGSTFGGEPDSYGDVVDKGAFTKTIAEGAKRIKILWNHQTLEPIGKPMELKEDEHGLHIKGKLSLGVQRAREVLSLMKDGVINELSIGYDAITEAIVGGVRHLKEIRLWDISPVTFAANPSALVLAVKNETDNSLTKALDEFALLVKGPSKDTPSEAAAQMALAEFQSIAQGFDVIKANACIESLLKTFKEVTSGK